MITVAYWDTEQKGRPPRLLGEIQGTPTIRLYKPKKKQAKPTSNADKTVMDYRFERKAKDMQQFIEDNMTNYVERVAFGMDDWKKIQAKAAKFGLPMAVFFTSKPKTTALLKWISTEFRRRLLVVQVSAPVGKNQPVLEHFGLNGAEAAPAMVVVTPGGERITYTEGDFSKRKLERFLTEHAAKDPVYKPVMSEGEAAADSDKSASHDSTKEEEKSKEEVRTEL